MIKEFTRPNIRGIRTEMDDALRCIGEKYGITFQINGITFGTSDFRCRVDAVVTGNSGDTVYSIEFKNKCYKYGFQKEDLGREFRSGDDRFEIVGLKSRNRKYPILAKKLRTGKLHKFTSNSVKLALKDTYGAVPNF